MFKGLNDEIGKRKSFNNPGKTRSKSNSMSSIDSKDGLNENVPSTLSEDVPSTRRSLRISENFDELELENDSSNKKKSLRANNKLDDPNKSKSSKLLNKNTPNQLKHFERNEKVSDVVRGQKRKSRNVSEPSLSSDNNKQTRSHKNNLTDKTVSDSSSRSVTPEILRGKTFNRSVTPETTTSRKSNLRSSDKDSKSTTRTVDKSCLKYGHNVDLILPEIKIERIKSADKNEKQVSNTDIKSKQPTQNKNESHIKLKGKIRNRVTSDLLVALQSPEIQSLGRRSCNNKS